VVDGTLVMLASVVHEVVKYYHRYKRSLNKIQILATKFEFGIKMNLTSQTTLHGREHDRQMFV